MCEHNYDVQDYKNLPWQFGLVDDIMVKYIKGTSNHNILAL